MAEESKHDECVKLYEKYKKYGKLSNNEKYMVILDNIDTINNYELLDDNFYDYASRDYSNLLLILLSNKEEDVTKFDRCIDFIMTNDKCELILLNFLEISLYYNIDKLSKIKESYEVSLLEIIKKHNMKNNTYKYYGVSVYMDIYDHKEAMKKISFRNRY